MAREIRVCDMLRGTQWTAKQAQAIESKARTLCIDGGRRFGKTWTGSRVVLRRLHRRHEAAVRARQRGEIAQWPGVGMPARLARHQLPNVSVVCITPRERHQEQCRTYILGAYQGAARSLLHPQLGLCDAGREIWIVYGGIASRIRFVTASGVAAVVSQAHDVIWVDEAGLVDGAVIEAALPTLWERDGETILTGTPSLGVEHWYSVRCLSGLDPGHPYYVQEVVDRDPDCETIIGTSYEAFLPSVRTAAKAEAERMGPAWARQWVLGDWRMPELFVYDQWDAQVHVVQYDHAWRQLLGTSLPPPSRVVGVVDWAYSQSTPGAAVVYHVWLRNPLDRGDRTRPLVVAVADHQGPGVYSHDGWWSTLERLRIEYGVQQWYADPSRDELVQAARKASARFGPIKGASKADKPGRLQLVAALLNHSETVRPAFYVASTCTHLPRQFARYRWRTDAKGNPRDVPIDYDDHCLDCTAFLVGEIMRGGKVVPSLVI